MRLCTFRDGAGSRLGRVENDVVLPLAGASVLDAIESAPGPSAGPPTPLGEVELLAPLRPPKVIGVGHNYRAHAEEIGIEPPGEPRLFAKLASSIVAPGGPIVHPDWTSELDYEGELAVVIGRRVRNISSEDALAAVFGYAVIDDVSARDLQRTEGNWVRAKGGDTFGPFGPWITTADEVPDPQALTIRTWVNGEQRQEGRTADMIFSVAELIEFCSRHFTLEPGDVIATGTPSGVGTWRDPPVHLAPGDVVRIEIDSLGVIHHEVVAPT
jgi:2-keto-4-pentenoate hydratase/2-oxohepta-3-ene-1,7-dioic acid hydratase in catechol pathway